jgi:hypothetical protein
VKIKFDSAHFRPYSSTGRLGDSLMPAPSRASAGRSSSSSSSSSGGDKKKLIAVGVMLSLAGLLLAYNFGLFDSVVSKPAKVDDKQQAEDTAEAKRQQEVVEREIKEGRAESAGS